jgi:hypothetical protein
VRSVQRSGDRAARDAEHLGDLVVREIRVVAQEQRVPLTVRKRRDGIPQVAELVRLDGGLGPIPRHLALRPPLLIDRGVMTIRQIQAGNASSLRSEWRSRSARANAS